MGGWGGSQRSWPLFYIGGEQGDASGKCLRPLLVAEETWVCACAHIKDGIMAAQSSPEFSDTCGAPHACAHQLHNI